MYIFISVMWSSILVLHHFIFDSKKLACTRTWAERNICPCMLHVLRGCPFYGEHFYLWMNVPGVTYVSYRRKKKSCGHRNSSFIYLPPIFNKTKRKFWSHFQPDCFQTKDCRKIIHKGGETLIWKSWTVSLTFFCLFTFEIFGKASLFCHLKVH